jgi:hypothetical protein
MTMTLVEQLMAELRTDGTLYIFSLVGHGRAGTIVALMLSRLYGIGAEEALTKTCHFHDARVDSRAATSPLRVVQFEQVRRLAPMCVSLYRSECLALPPPMPMPPPPMPPPQVPSPATSSGDVAQS